MDSIYSTSSSNVNLTPATSIRRPLLLTLLLWFVAVIVEPHYDDDDDKLYSRLLTLPIANANIL